MIPIAKPIIEKEEITAVKRVLQSGIIACGEEVNEFEKQFSKFIGTKYAVAVNSGTAALHIALLSVGITSGDEVIIPSFSFIATANSILFCNATPKFCDIDHKTFNINPDKIEKLINKKTKAVMPVHLYGQPAEMQRIKEIAEKKDLFIIGDAAQAHGAKFDGKMIGSFGDVECFSFYPTKNMTCGEGGMITTNNQHIAELAYSFRNHGRKKINFIYDHYRLGYNYRMTDISAAIGEEQLKKLPDFNTRRKENAKYFNEKLTESDNISIPYVAEKVEHVYHQYTIKCQTRNDIVEKLKENRIGYGIYYPKPLHSYTHLKKYAHPDLKISEKSANVVLSLPTHPSLSNEDLDKIIDTVK